MKRRIRFPLHDNQLLQYYCQLHTLSVTCFFQGTHEAQNEKKKLEKISEI